MIHKYTPPASPSQGLMPYNLNDSDKTRGTVSIPRMAHLKWDAR